MFIVTNPACELQYHYKRLANVKRPCDCSLQCAVPTSEKFTVKLSAHFRHDVIRQHCALS